MAVASGNFRQLMKKLSFKNVNDSGYEKMENGDYKETCSPKTGFIPIYVGEERKRYLVPTAAANSAAFKALLDQYEDEFTHSGALTVPCSTEAFEYVLRRAIAQTRT
ncbi:hypothetical protein BUALT_Bualt09G0085500 [Buddleja alternifolia]|uniref:Uncharacterized protein n=1 Tax=Buddleja alternifolia TaxID=168488 RepID=A0AAV6XBV8_9LAMI|nr:hypothetical protein BUALT_Bualt09G0085500 [Buddleja alternifolia]